MDVAIWGLIGTVITGLIGFFSVKYKSKADLEGIKTTAEDKAAADLFGAYDKFVERFSEQLKQERLEFEKKLAAADKRNDEDRAEWAREREIILARMAIEQSRCDERIDLLESKVTALMMQLGTTLPKD